MPKFYTLTEQFQVNFVENRNTFSESMINNTNKFVRFDSNARVEIFIDESEIVGHVDYEGIMENNTINDASKVKLLEQLVIKMINEKINTMETEYGVAITTNTDPNNLRYFRFSLENLIEKYTQNKLSDKNV